MAKILKKINVSMTCNKLHVIPERLKIVPQKAYIYNGNSYSQHDDNPHVPAPVPGG